MQQLNYRGREIYGRRICALSNALPDVPLNNNRISCIENTSSLHVAHYKKEESKMACVEVGTVVPKSGPEFLARTCMFPL